MPKQQATNLSDPRLLRLILRIGAPAILGLSANAINQLIDALWITRLSPIAMAGVGIAFPVIILMTATTAGIGVAISGEIGRRLGRNDTSGAQSVALTAIILAIALSVVIGLGIGSYVDVILPVFGASTETFPIAKLYITVLLWGLPIMTFQIIADYVALGSGNSRRSMQTLLACFGLNIVLDPIFIFGFGWGVTGAALATVAGQLLACCIYIVWFRKGTLGLYPFAGSVASAHIRNLVRFAPPVVVVNLLMAFSFVVLLSGMARLAGDVHVAALAFDLRLATLIMIPVQGLALGAQAAISHAHGHCKPLRANHLIHLTLALSVGTGVILTCLVVAGGRFLFPIMIPAPAMQQAAATMFPYFAVFIIGSCAYIPLLSGFRATDRALFSAVVALAPNGYVMVPLILLLPLVWGLSGLLWAIALSGVVTAVIAGVLHLIMLSRSSVTVTAAPADTA